MLLKAYHQNHPSTLDEEEQKKYRGITKRLTRLLSEYRSDFPQKFTISSCAGIVDFSEAYYNSVDQLIKTSLNSNECVYQDDYGRNRSLSQWLVDTITNLPDRSRRSFAKPPKKLFSLLLKINRDLLLQSLLPVIEKTIILSQLGLPPYVILKVLSYELNVDIDDEAQADNRKYYIDVIEKAFISHKNVIARRELLKVLKIIDDINKEGGLPTADFLNADGVESRPISEAQSIKNDDAEIKEKEKPVELLHHFRALEKEARQGMKNPSTAHEHYKNCIQIAGNQLKEKSHGLYYSNLKALNLLFTLTNKEVTDTRQQTESELPPEDVAPLRL